MCLQLCTNIDEIDSLKRELLLSQTVQEQLKQKSVTEVRSFSEIFHVLISFSDVAKTVKFVGNVV